LRTQPGKTLASIFSTDKKTGETRSNKEHRF